MDQEPLVKELMAERAKVIGFIMVLIGGQNGAEDIFQDVCVLALEKRSAIRDEAHLKAWLRLSSRNLARNWLRKRNRRELPLGDDILDLIEQHWQRRDGERSSAVLDALDLCLAGLSAKGRDLIERRYIRRTPLADIAAALGRPLGSLYVTFCRLHAALADCVRQRLSAGGAAHG